MALFEGAPTNSCFQGCDEELLEYPPEMCIKNGFICFNAPVSPSPDEFDFLRERRVKSCPDLGLLLGEGSIQELLVKTDSIRADDAAVALASTSTACSSDSLGDEGDLDHMDADAGLEAPSQVLSEKSDSIEPRSNLCSADLFEDIGATSKKPDVLLPSVIRLAPWRKMKKDTRKSSASSVSTLCSSERVEDIGATRKEPDTSLLSVSVPPADTGNLGSAAHLFSKCKPCAFFHTKGCESGADCMFCHLCVPGAKKMIKKQKRVMRRLRDSLPANSAMGGLPPFVVVYVLPGLTQMPGLSWGYS